MDPGASEEIGIKDVTEQNEAKSKHSDEKGNAGRNKGQQDAKDTRQKE